MTQDTNLLGLTRATKKVEYWKGLQEQGKSNIVSIEDGEEVIYEVWERIKYWENQVSKYEKRIKKHIHELETIKDPVSFFVWISSIVSTIKEIIETLTKIKI